MTPSAYMLDYNSTSDIMDMIAKINGQLDKTNLYHAFNAGEYNYPIQSVDLSKIGNVRQDLQYEEDIRHLTGTITANYVQFGSDYVVKIELDYIFN